MTRTFSAPRSYHPSYSLLGRAVRALVNDRLRGEAFFIVAVTGLALALILSHYLAWALLNPVLTGTPWGQTLFWGGQVISVFVLVGIGLVGFRPAVSVTCQRHAVELTQGTQSRTLSYSSIFEIDTISAQRYHRHYRCYAATQVFMSRVPDEVILLRTTDGPIVVGLPDPDARAALLDLLRPRISSSPEPVAQIDS